MDHVKMRKKGGRLWVLLVPFVLSALAAATGRPLAHGAYFLSLPLAIAALPACHGQANLTLFALQALSAIPLNLALAIRAARSELIADLSYGSAWAAILWGVLIYALLFSLQQVVMGSIVRMIWPNQSSDERATHSGERRASS